MAEREIMGYGPDWQDEEDDLYPEGCPGCGALRDEDCICEAEFYDDDEFKDEYGYPD